MTRSLKKGPFTDAHLVKKVETAQANKDKKPVKTCNFDLLHFSRHYIAQTMCSCTKGLFFLNDCLQPSEVLTQGIQQQSIRPRMP